MPPRFARRDQEELTAAIEAPADTIQHWIWRAGNPVATKSGQWTRKCHRAEKCTAECCRTGTGSGVRSDTGDPDFIAARHESLPPLRR